MLALLLLAGSLMTPTNCITNYGEPCANLTVDLQEINRVVGPGEFSDCPQLRVLPNGDVLCDTGGAGILMQRPGHEWWIIRDPGFVPIPTPVYEDIGPTMRDARSCHDALWLVVRDAIDVLSGRDLRIRPTLQRAAEACE